MPLPLSLSQDACVVLLICAATAVPSSAQVNFNTLVYFDRTTNGSGPSEPPVQGTDGNLYGTTFLGGTEGDGTIFKMTTGGTLTTIYTFCVETFPCTDGAFPSGLLQATNGNFYGTTLNGGTHTPCAPSAVGCGTVFKITPAGTLTTLYSFCSQTGCTDGNFPSAGLMQGRDGSFYGTTYLGGVKCSNLGGCGTVFKITHGGELTTLYSFCAQNDPNCTDGANPNAPLLQATDGNFYGTTYAGGSNSHGTIFRITPSGKLTSIYTFCATANCTDGDNPNAALLQATDGNFYGTTYFGGGNCISVGGCGTVFEITPAGTLTTLHTFDSTDGANPGGLVQATNGTFYGTTYGGGDQQLWHGFQPVRGARPVRGNTAHLRQRGRTDPDSRERPQGRNKRYI